MTEHKLTFEDGPILIDLSETKPKGGTLGYRDVKQDGQDEQDRAEKSDVAMNNAIETVYRTAKRVSTMMNSMEDESLTKMEMEFGLSLKEDSSVVIAKVGPEIHFRVKLTWGKDDTDD